ncbi:MAG: AEC family transporter, partial [Anaerolineae bacterium]|nr:AEC family transporter [Anaerolineae bacterium]
MAELLSIILDVIAPIFIVMGIAYFIGRKLKPDPRSISPFLIYLFTPALVFRSLYETELTGGEIGGLTGVVFGVAFLMMLVGIGTARLFKYDTRTESAQVLTLIMVNAANYGITLNTFAFGEVGGQVATVYYVMNAMMSNVFGVFFASRGSVSLKDSMLNVVRVPIIYAAILGLALNILDVKLPIIIERAFIDIAADAAIPLMLALLGLQLSRVRLSGRMRAVSLAAAMRLLLGPVFGAGLALLFGLSGLPFK